MRRRRWLVLLILLGAVVGLVLWRKGSLKQLSSNLKTFSAPTAGLYDALFGNPARGFYSLVAEDVLSQAPAGEILDVGSGPGRLAVLLAKMDPRVDVTGVDISPEMVAKASRRAAKAGLAERVHFAEGEVESLPFADDRFAAVVSTFSLHHWSYPVGGLQEIHRVLKPGGRALIYDLPGWFQRMMRHGGGPEHLAAATPFRRGTLEIVRWPWQIPFFARLELRKDSRAR